MKPGDSSKSPHVCRAQTLMLSFTDFPGHRQGIVLEVEHLGYKLVLNRMLAAQVEC